MEMDKMYSWWHMLRNIGMFKMAFDGAIYMFFLRVLYHCIVKRDDPKKYNRFLIVGLVMVGISVVVWIWTLVMADRYEMPVFVMYRTPLEYILVGTVFYWIGHLSLKDTKLS